MEEICLQFAVCMQSKESKEGFGGLVESFCGRLGRIELVETAEGLTWRNLSFGGSLMLPWYCSIKLLAVSFWTWKKKTGPYTKLDYYLSTSRNS